MTQKIALNLTPKKSTGKTKFSFIMNYDYKASACFTLVGGKAGGPIYNYLKFKKGMNGDHFYKIPNNHMLVKYGLRRQRVSEALILLEAEGLIQCKREVGKSTRVRLAIKIYE